MVQRTKKELREGFIRLAKEALDESICSTDHEVFHYLLAVRGGCAIALGMKDRAYQFADLLVKGALHPRFAAELKRHREAKRAPWDGARPEGSHANAA